MNKQQKQVIQHQYRSEKEVLKELEQQYQEALDEINEKIQMYQAMPETQSRIYRQQYQERMKQQVEAAIEKLHSREYETIDQYLNDVYIDGFVGTMYDLHGQGVPVIAPIDQNAAIKAVMTDTKLKHKLYNELGFDMNALKKTISSELSRGISSGMAYDDVARNIKNATKVPMGRAKVIVRTEGHRIQQASAEDARQAAKSKGADVVKQWDATLDGDTRPRHRRLDGQIRETDKPFEMDGKEAMYPGDFGDAAEDCNCRCVALTRARAALDEDELKFLRQRAVQHSLYMEEPADYRGEKLPQLKNYTEFKKRYLEASEQIQIDQRPKKPSRPRRSHFDDDDAYEAAREQYRRDKAQYEMEVDKAVKASLNRERKYKNASDVTEWAENYSVNISGEVFRHVDTRAFDDVIEVQEEMFERFPQGKKSWELYGNKYTLGYDSDSYAFMSANGGLNFHGKYFDDFEDALRESIGMQDRGFTVYGDGTFKSHLRHEYGHNVDDYIKLHRFNSLYEGKRNAPFEPNRRREYEQELLALANHTGASEYAKTNSSEAFAEGFAEYTSNPESEYGKAFGEFLERWLVD